MLHHPLSRARAVGLLAVAAVLACEQQPSRLTAPAGRLNMHDPSGPDGGYMGIGTCDSSPGNYTYHIEVTGGGEHFLPNGAYRTVPVTGEETDGCRLTEAFWPMDSASWQPNLTATIKVTMDSMPVGRRVDSIYVERTGLSRQVLFGVDTASVHLGFDHVSLIVFFTTDNAVPTFRPGIDSMIVDDDFDNYSTVAAIGSSSWDFAPLQDSMWTVITPGVGGTGRALRASIDPSLWGQSPILSRAFGVIAQHVVVQWSFRLSSGGDPTFGGVSDGSKWFTLERYGAQRMTNGFNHWDYAGYTPRAKSGVEWHVRDNEIIAAGGPTEVTFNQTDSTWNLSDVNDGQWHVYTIEAQNNNGVATWYRIWVDGHLVLDTSTDPRASNAAGFDGASWINVTPIWNSTFGPGYTHDLDHILVWKQPY